jgi:hypothetical protein
MHEPREPGLRIIIRYAVIDRQRVIRGDLVHEDRPDLVDLGSIEQLGDLDDPVPPVDIGNCLTHDSRISADGSVER